MDRAHRSADQAYLCGRVREAIELYGRLLERSAHDLAALAALSEIAFLLVEFSASDPIFAAARIPVRRRLLEILCGRAPRCRGSRIS